MEDRAPFLVRYADRAAWAVARQAEHRIGGSDVANLLGVGFESPWSLWLRAQGVDLGDGGKAGLFAEGHAWEGFVLDIYAEQTGADLEPMADTIMVDARDPWAVGSFDGIVSDGQLGGVDAKTDRTGEHVRASGTIERWSDDSEGLLSPVYASQMYHYLEISGLPWWDVAAVCLPAPVITDGALLLTLAATLAEHPPELTEMVRRLRRRATASLRIVRVMRDEEMQATIRGAVRERRQRWLIDGEQPPIDHHTACRRGVADPSATAVKRATLEQAAAALDIAGRKRQLAADRETLATLQNEFISRMNARKLTGEGWSATQTRNHQLRFYGL